MIGIIDCGVGNHASVKNFLTSLGYRSKIISDLLSLDEVNIILIPGVGAFSEAMHSLHRSDLLPYLMDKILKGTPVIGICLGMQLLTQSSDENGFCEGLGLIPGKVRSIKNSRFHIGWNSLNFIKNDILINASNLDDFYFNHSYCYEGPKEFQLATTTFEEEIVAIINKDKIYGLQFHPEKSQESGKLLLKKLIDGLVNA